MATTVFFEENIRDKENKAVGIEMEFGRSSYYGESLMYFTIEGNSVIVDEATGRKVYESMKDLAVYLGYEKN